jgi:peptidoglycan hydrolase CwlO-like protein
MREIDMDKQLSDVDKQIKRLQDKRERDKRSLKVILERSEETQKEVKVTREELVVLYDISLKVCINV